MDQGTGKNTDTEIWRRIPGDFYSPSIHVTEHGDIGINVGGHVLVAPVEQWHSAGKAVFCVEERPSYNLLRHFFRWAGSE